MEVVIFTAQTDCIKLFSLTTKVPFFANATIAFMCFILPMTLSFLEPFERMNTLKKNNCIWLGWF